MSSCMECKIDYMMDKLDTYEGCIRRMTNKLHCSPQTAEIADVQRANAYDIREFEERWNGGRVCTHERTEGEINETAGYVPEPHEHEEVEEPVGNIGVSAIPSRGSTTATVGGRTTTNTAKRTGGRRR